MRDDVAERLPASALNSPHPLPAPPCIQVTLLLRDAQMFKRDSYQMIGCVLLATNLILIGLVGRAVAPGVLRNLALVSRCCCC